MRAIRRALAVTAAAAVLLTSACGGGQDAAPAANAAPSTPAVSADACRAYDNALSIFVQGIDGNEQDPMVILDFGPDAATKIRTAAELAAGPAKAAMTQSATRIQVLADAEQRWTQPGFDVSAELAAVKTSITEVDRMCRAAGASLSHVPGPAVATAG